MTRSLTPLTLGFLLAIGACNQPAPEAASSDGAPTASKPGEAPAVDAGEGAIVGELTAVSGPAGIRSAELAEGTFLGKGARVRAGQRLQVPVGTLAEVTLASGGTLRLNEKTELSVDAAPRSVTLHEGEVVAIITNGQAPLSIRGDDDVFTVAQGEARALSREGEHDYAVVYGHAKVESAGKSVDLSAGATLHTPLAAAAPLEPVVSLRPLDDTAWARAFDQAAQMAEAVPVGVGALTARRAGESAERYSLSLVDQKVNVTISGRIALTEIEQTFYNEAPLVLEGTYRFPLPADASISGLALLVGSRWEDAAMLDKERARSIFKQIVEATVPRDPALLEWEQGNIFKLKIFPIPGRGERKIRLRYTQVLPAVGDNLRYRYPLSGTSSGASGTAIGDFDFHVSIDRSELPADAINTLRTPMAALERREVGDKIELSSHQRAFRPVHDLGVDIPLPAADRRMHAETHLDRDGQAYFMVALQPSLPLAKDERPVHYAFVVDRSHSQTPELFTVARTMIQALGVALDDDDRLTVLACDDACDVAPGGLHPPGRDDLLLLDTFLEGQVLAGASDLGGMMRSAADALQSADGPAPGERVIVYLGDGNASAGELAPDELLRHMDGPLAGIRVQAVALGARSDLLLLGNLAKKTGGDLVQADARDDLAGLVRELRLRAEVPVARDVSLELPAGMVMVHPEHLASFRPGDTVVLTGKLSQAVAGPLTIRARGPGGEAVSDSFNVTLAADRSDPSGRHAHLPRTWAREQIELLTATKGNAAKAEIIDLSKRYTVLSRYTALLVLENDAMFREFNVVRNAGQTDAWGGKLDPATTTRTGNKVEAAKDSKTDASAASEVASAPPSPSPVAEPEPDAPKGGGSGRASRDEAGPADKSPMPQEAPESEDRGDSLADFDDEAPTTKSAPRASSSTASTGSATKQKKESADEVAEEKNAPAPRAPAKSSTRPMPPGQIAGDPLGDLDGYGSGYGSGGLGKGSYYRQPHLKVSSDVAPSARDRARVDELRSARDRDPSSRSAHRRLVQAAIYYGVPEALDYAKAWAAADPDHSPALLAVADLLAAHGEPVAPRAYASAVEIRPFDGKLQGRIADAFMAKGDTARACAHLRAVVSIDPAKADHHADLARCLGRLTRWDLAQAAIDDGRSRAKGSQKALQSAADEVSRRLIPIASPAALHGYADLKATLTWSGDADLDLVVVDRRGRRLSSLRREVILVREGRGEEIVTLRSVDNPVFLEVTRVDPSGPPVSAELKVQTSTDRTSYTITSGHETLRLAKVYWTR